MNLNQFQKAAVSTAIYPERGKLGGFTYAVLGLASEAGELAGKLKKIIRDDNGQYYRHREELMHELSDALWYVADAAGELGYTLEEVGQFVLDKLRDRARRGVLQGSGDNR